VVLILSIHPLLSNRLFAENMLVMVAAQAATVKKVIAVQMPVAIAYRQP
jgi:hypothetical protein